MSKSDRSFESYFNRLDHISKVHLANRRIQNLELDLKWCDVMEVDDKDPWFLYTRADLDDVLARWLDVRDRLVFSTEEVNL